MQNLKILHSLLAACLLITSADGMQKANRRLCLQPLPHAKAKKQAINTITIFWEAIDRPYPQVVDLLFKQNKIDSGLKDWLGNSILSRAILQYSQKRLRQSADDHRSVIQIVLAQKNPVVTDANIQEVLTLNDPKLIKLFNEKYPERLRLVASKFGLHPSKEPEPTRVPVPKANPKHQLTPLRPILDLEQHFTFDNNPDVQRLRAQFNKEAAGAPAS